MNQEAKNRIADDVTDSIYGAYPELWERFGENGYTHTKKDNHHHLDHLETAYALGQEKVFLDYTEWLDGVLTSRNVGTELIIDNFNRLIDALPGRAAPEEADFMAGCLRRAVRQLEQK
ncbi:hypothetical protein [Indiicoccus explosivorum]|uniref:hypothetical protein n=1 Tax=Indiicoccus explosivorum TaxID=1917864 RepID=UPI000B44BF02|nr:hypothetical protein [Indiicoccus explosivorum]